MQIRSCQVSSKNWLFFNGHRLRRCSQAYCQRHCTKSLL